MWLKTVDIDNPDKERKWQLAVDENGYSVNCCWLNEDVAALLDFAIFKANEGRVAVEDFCYILASVINNTFGVSVRIPSGYAFDIIFAIYDKFDYNTSDWGVLNPPK